jgi:hypothetical protein
MPAGISRGASIDFTSNTTPPGRTREIQTLVKQEEQIESVDLGEEDQGAGVANNSQGPCLTRARASWISRSNSPRE